MSKRKKYAAVRTEFYTVYKYSFAFGAPFRMPVISFPLEAEALDWVEEHKKEAVEDGYKLGVEPMSAIIRAWDGQPPA